MQMWLLTLMELFYMQLYSMFLLFLKEFLETFCMCDLDRVDSQLCSDNAINKLMQK